MNIKGQEQKTGGVAGTLETTHTRSRTKNTAFIFIRFTRLEKISKIKERTTETLKMKQKGKRD